jgi:hypothetical protein
LGGSRFIGCVVSLPLSVGAGQNRRGQGAGGRGTGTGTEAASLTCSRLPLILRKSKEKKWKEGRKEGTNGLRVSLSANTSQEV